MLYISLLSEMALNTNLMNSESMGTPLIISNPAYMLLSYTSWLINAEIDIIMGLCYSIIYSFFGTTKEFPLIYLRFSLKAITLSLKSL